MTSLFIGLYGLYLIMVGVQGNASTLISEVESDAPQFLPWLLAIVALAFLNEFESTKKFVKPFAALIVLNFFLKNFGTIKQQVSSIYNSSQKGN